jgi:hypothetical protein
MQKAQVQEIIINRALHHHNYSFLIIHHISQKGKSLQEERQEVSREGNSPPRLLSMCNSLTLLL